MTLVAMQIADQKTHIVEQLSMLDSLTNIHSMMKDSTES